MQTLIALAAALKAKQQRWNVAKAKNAAANGEAQGAPVQVTRKIVTHAPAYLRRSRSVRLIEGLLATGKVGSDDLACALSVTSPVLESYRRGHARMPLERQLCLALLVIERWPYTPRLRRNGFGLRSQALAEVAFRARITKTHMAPMVTAWVRPPRRSLGLTTLRPQSER